MRIITALTSVILVATSLWCFLHLGNTFLSVAFLLGVAMIISALGSICSYIGSYKDIEKSSWILADGITTGVLGLLVLANQLTVEPMIPIFFGIWIMYSGMLRIIAAAHMMLLDQEHKNGWAWCLGFGSLAILIGVYAFFNNAAFDFSNVLLVGVIFLVQGVNVMALAVNMPGKYKIITDEDILHRKKKEAKEEANKAVNFKFQKTEQKPVEYPDMTPLADPDIDIAGKVNAVFEKDDQDEKDEE